jgi:glutaminyl-tRNA synthetase
LRDPAIYRIRFAEHHNTGDKWCVYPMYTFAHPIEDSLENITHSICTLEFENQRAFYDWALERIIPALRAPQFEEAKEVIAKMARGEDERALAFVRAAYDNRAKLGQSTPELAMAELFESWDNQEGPEKLKGVRVSAFWALLQSSLEHFTPLLQAALDVVRPNFFLLSHQYEFNRLSLSHVVVSKRKLIQLVNEKLVSGWDDPRMPTIFGIRRRGFTPESIHLFVERCGISRIAGGMIDYSVLEACLREDLENRVARRIAVVRPLKLIIDNYPEGQSETLVAPNHPQKAEWGTREVSFSRELWIDESDFAEVPPKGYRRLTIPADGSEAKPVRLRYGYVVVPTSIDKDENGMVVAVHCNYLPDTKSGTPGSESVKTKAAIHWLDAKTAVKTEMRLYDRLFAVAQPDAVDADYRTLLNPNSLEVVTGYVEPALAEAKPEEKFQFERTGYFVADRVDHTAEAPVYNLSVGLKDSWSKK